MREDYRAVLDRMHLMTGIQFERLCASLFEALGYEVQPTAASADRGIDLELTKGGKVVLVQCKRQQSAVGEPAVRDFFGVVTHRGADKGIFCTNGSFSTRAESWAAGTRMELMDGAELVKLLDQFEVPVPDVSHQGDESPGRIVRAAPIERKPQGDLPARGRRRLTPEERVQRARDKWAASGCEELGIPRPMDYKPNGELKKHSYVGPDGLGHYVVVREGRVLFLGTWKDAMGYYDRAKHDW